LAKVENSVTRSLLSGETPEGEGSIEARKTALREKFDEKAFETLPDKAPALWPGRPRGRPKVVGGPDPLIIFIRKTYGPYMTAHRDKLRVFIYRNDRKLYQAINNYEKDADLPRDIRMPSAPELVIRDFKKATAKGLEALEKTRRRAVVRKARRLTN
jgi:hypothetical protein